MLESAQKNVACEFQRNCDPAITNDLVAKSHSTDDCRHSAYSHGYRMVKSCSSCCSVDARMRIKRSTFCARSGGICRSGWDLASHQSNGCNLSVCSDCHVDQADEGFLDPSYGVPAPTTDPGVPRSDLPVINITASFSWSGCSGRGCHADGKQRCGRREAVNGVVYKLVF